MKVLNKKTAILACLSLTVAMGAVGVATLSGVKASADSPFMMEKGASLYLDELSGLKFSFTDSDYNSENPATYGMLIVPYDYLAKAGITDLGTENDFIGKLNQAHANGAIDNAPIVTEVLPDANGVFSHSVGELNEYNYAREFFGIGYKVTGENTYEYATQNDNVRSVFEVANLALNCHVYDAGEFDGEAGLSQEEQDEFQNIDDNKEVVENFITTGFAFVYGTATPTVSVGATCVDGEEVTPAITLPEKQKNIELGTHVRYVLAENDTVAEMTDEGKVKALTRGQSTLTAGIGGVITAETKTAVLKDATELQIYNDSTDAYFFETVSAPTVGGTYTAQLKGGFWDDYSATDNYEDPGYLAIKNPNSGDGTYTLDTNGTYVDFYFKGNNMPNVEFFGTTIESLSLGKGGDTENTKNAPTGYVVFNGAARADTYKKWDALQAAEKDITNFTITENGVVTGVVDGITTYSAYRYGGLAAREPFFMYGISDRGDTANCFSRARYSSTSTSSGSGFLRNFDQGGSLSMLYNQTSTVSNWASKTINNFSKFSIYSLMSEGEDQYWHYQVGVKLSKTTPVLVATLWKTDANGNHVDADPSTSDTVDAFATYTKKSNCGAISNGSGVSGYILVYGALKGDAERAGTRYNTQLAYTMPYAGA